jgi:hypothetical protein
MIRDEGILAAFVAVAEELSRRSERVAARLVFERPRNSWALPNRQPFASSFSRLLLRLIRSATLQD